MAQFRAPDGDVTNNTKFRSSSHSQKIKHNYRRSVYIDNNNKGPPKTFAIIYIMNTVNRPALTTQTLYSRGRIGPVFMPNITTVLGQGTSLIP
jgi:hypothetical protein